MDLIVLVSTIAFVVVLSLIAGVMGIGITSAVDTTELAESTGTLDVIGNAVSFFGDLMTFQLDGAEWFSGIIVTIIVATLALTLMRFLRGQ